MGGAQKTQIKKHSTNAIAQHMTSTKEATDKIPVYFAPHVQHAG